MEALKQVTGRDALVRKLVCLVLIIITLRLTSNMSQSYYLMSLFIKL